LARRKSKSNYWARKPKQQKCAESNKTIIAQGVPVPLTREGIERLGGLHAATESVSAQLGYKVTIKEVKGAPPKQMPDPKSLAEMLGEHLSVNEIRELNRKLC